MKTILAVLFTLISSLAFCQQPRQATLAQQKMCADQAKKAFDAKGLDNRDEKDFTQFYQHTNHYDAVHQKCYLVEQETTWNRTDGTFKNIEDVEIYDAFEGNNVATFIELNSEPPSTCYVTPRGQDILKCQNSREFRHLIYKHFGIEY